MTVVAERQPARSLETRIRHAEDRDAWSEVRRHGHRIHLAVTAERPDIVVASAGELAVLADRRLRQLGESA